MGYGFWWDFEGTYAGFREGIGCLQGGLWVLVGALYGMCRISSYLIG